MTETQRKREEWESFLNQHGVDDGCGNLCVWRVRIGMRGCGMMTHLISRTKPKVHLSVGQVSGIDMDVITDTKHGDEIGYIDYSEVDNVSWRKETIDE